MVKIRLKRFGAAKRPCYRIVIQDARRPRDGKTIEEIGFFQPIAPEGSQVSFNEERAKYWMSVGAQPTDTVRRLFSKKGLFNK